MKKETWKQITGYSEYQVSSKGRIASKKGRTFKILSPHKNTKGYLRVSISNNGNEKKFFVHRLVAQAFCVGYDEGKEVNHINGNKLDNNYNNLEWVSHKDNSLHAKSMGLLKSRKIKVINIQDKSTYSSIVEAYVYSGCRLKYQSFYNSIKKGHSIYKIL